MTSHEDGHHIRRLIEKISGQPQSYSRKSNYTFGKTLGAGAFGIVRYGRNNTTGEEEAIKIILKKALKGNEQMILDELKLLEELHHPNIVGFRDWFESKDKFYIVTQLATGGELFDRIVEQGKFTEYDAANVVKQILEALKYLHSKNIVHRDLKPENILYLTPDPDSNVVLADFGIAKKLQSLDEVLRSSAGSFGYAAPEVVLGVGHGKPCDIWSLGVVTYTMLCGYSPFRSDNVNDFIMEVKKNNTVIFHADYWKDTSRESRRFIVKAMQLDPRKRPDAATLLEDPWIVSIAKQAKNDLLPHIKEGFDAKHKFRQAIQMVKLNNKIKKLKEYQTEEDDDPLEINLFGDSGTIVEGKDATTSSLASRKATEPLSTLKESLQEALEMNEEDVSKSSLSPNSKANTKLDMSAKTSTKKALAGDAFVQLVRAATQNKERVASYTGSQDKSSLDNDKDSENEDKK